MKKNTQMTLDMFGLFVSMKSKDDHKKKREIAYDLLSMYQPEELIEADFPSTFQIDKLTAQKRT